MPARVLLQLMHGVIRRLFPASRSGQTIVEYAVIAGMIVTSAAILTLFLSTFKEYGGRIHDLAGSEYP